MSVIPQGDFAMSIAAFLPLRHAGRPAFASQARLAIQWATACDAVGNAFGYSLGNRLGRQAALAAGIEVRDDAPIALHHCPPHAFRPVAGKVNVLWTAWEFGRFTPAEVEGLRRAHAVFVTARFLVEPVESQSGAPAFYVPQGVRASVFPYVKRRDPRGRGGRFRFLWVGAPNDRKGWRHALAAWRAFVGDPACELVLKTTFASGQLEGGLSAANVTVDTARRSDEEMAALYASAHCFLLPSLGEGFGFTLGEAMASGLPCVYTPATSMNDLCPPGCGYPLRYDMAPCFELSDTDGGQQTMTAAWPAVDSLVQNMRRVMDDYPEALRRGRAAARFIRQRFLWRHSGAALRRALALVRDAVAWDGKRGFGA